MNYYNENNPKTAAWLRELIRAGVILPGHVDQRSIVDVAPDDLRGFAQVHLFAGIGGWSYALRLAGWPDHRPVWTGSCPCQPFSCAGKRRGKKDPRHLWPEMLRLIAECKPPNIFGEQVAGKAGRLWLSGVRTDLETLAYAVGAADLCAAGVSAPHIRQRLCWLADSLRAGRPEGWSQSRNGQVAGSGSPGGLANLPSERQHRAADSSQPNGRPLPEERSATGWLANPDKPELRHQPSAGKQSRPEQNRGTGRLADPERSERRTLSRARAMEGLDRLQPQRKESSSGLAGDREAGRMGDTHWIGSPSRIPESDQGPEGNAKEPVNTSRGSSAWSAFDLLHCTDGKARRIESGTFPLAHGVPYRVAALSGYGNAIVPQLAAEFIASYLDLTS